MTTIGLVGTAGRPAWLAAADAKFGIRETPGPGNTPAIMAWVKNFPRWVRDIFTGDAVPWCALFVNQCLLEAGVKGTPDVLSAGSFATWGVPLGGPALGAIATFVRPGGHHVGFYLGQRADGAIRVRGGNQGDAVSDIWMPAGRLIAYRWPAGVALPFVAAVVLADNGEPLSSQEA